MTAESAITETDRSDDTVAWGSDLPHTESTHFNNRTFGGGHALTPGYNVDPVDGEAGMRMLAEHYPDASNETRMVVDYALARHARGEEKAAQKGAIDQSFHGINLTLWYMVLAAAVASGEEKLKAAQQAADAAG